MTQTDMLSSDQEDLRLLRERAVGNVSVDVLSNFYKDRPTTIYGGSNEIQRNILSKAVLELPG